MPTRSGALLAVITLALVAACSSDPPAATKPGVDAGGTDAGTTPEEDGGTPPVVSEKVNVKTETLDVEGTAREYVLAVPKTYDQEKAYPLVLVFHGDGGTGPGMRQFHTFDAASGDEAIVAYPTGINAGWDMDTPSATNRDMKFVDALVAKLSADYRIDAARLFGDGYSAGAFLINKIACRRTGFFRGIVSHAGGAPNEPSDPAATQWPGSGFTKCAGQTGGVAAMIVHGKDDGAVTFDSGDFSAVYWAALNGCSDNRSTTTPEPCLKYDGCPTDKPVLWCLIPGLGHSVWQNGAKEGWAWMKKL
jgi:polyhydroxybutyrate depolymerase